MSGFRGRRVGKKAPEEMTPGEINRELNALDKADSDLTTALIARGFGNVRFSELEKELPPDLYQIHQTIYNRQRQLRNEIAHRYGPGAPARLPAGFKKRQSNPIHRARGGWQWGEHGHVYKSKAGAERQMRAIFASGYRGRNPLSRGESWFVVLMKRPDGERLYLTASGKGEYWMQNAKLFKSEADARKAVGKILRKHPGSRESEFEIKRIV